MLKNKTSVLFVNTNGKDNKVLQVPTKILLHWKKYLVGLVSVILVLVAMLGVFIYRTTSDSYKEKLAKANKIKSLIDLNKVKKSFKSIDESTYRINSFLEQRGLNKMKIDNAGGETNFEINDINEIAEYYESKMKDLEATVKKIPMGIPHNGRITSDFGYRSNPFTGKQTETHSGLDFKGNIGDPIKTTADGTIEFAGVKGGYGNCIIVAHENNVKTLYGHLSKIRVRENQKVNAGDVIGDLGNTGRSTGPHLHYEIIVNNEKINPEPYTKF